MTSSTSAATSRPRELHELPGPTPWPLLGNLPGVKLATIHQTVERWAREHGPFFRFRLGSRRFLGVADPLAIAQMLRDRPDGFSRSRKLTEIWHEMGLDDGVFHAEGEVWQRQRRMVMAAFDPGHVRDYYPRLLSVAQRLDGRWRAAARAGQAIDLQADLMRFTVDAISGLAFGADINTLESDDAVIQRHLDRIFPALFKRTLALLPTWRWFKGAEDRRLDQALVEVKAAIAGFVAQARQRLVDDPARRAQPDNLLEAMIVAADTGGSGGGNDISDRDVAGNVLTMLLAGEDTTANTLAWMLDLLWRHPEALKRAQDEVRGVVGELGALTIEQLQQLDWVEACCNETMRLKPVAPQNILAALRDTTVAGVRIPRGTVVWCAMRSGATDEAHFTDAARFDPTRWLAGDAAAPASAKRIAMPFGAGPRVCPGRYLALLEMKLAMAMLLSSFDIESVSTPNGQPAAEHLAFTMAPLGLTMRLRERQPAA